MVPKRDAGIDVARCLSNYMIILLHASAVNQYCNQKTLEASVWNFIYIDVCSTALPVLFMISGFLLFKNYSVSDYTNKIRRRIGRLVVPYISWNAFFILFYLVGSLVVPRLALRVDGFHLFSFSGIVDKMFSLMAAPIDGPLWFIRTLFVYSLISPIIALFLKKVYLRVLFIACVIILGAWFAEIGVSPRLSLTYPAYSLLMFFIGGIISKTTFTPVNIFRSKKMLFLSLITLAIVSIINSIFLSNIVKEVCIIVQYFLKATVFLGVISLIDLSFISKSLLYKKLREMSFFAYSGHFLFCSILLHITAQYFTFIETGRQTILTLIFFVGGTSVIYVVFFACKRFCPNILKLFDGDLKI